MLQIRNISLAPDADKPQQLRKAAAKKLQIPVGEIRDLTILRRSIDARKKDRIQIIYTVNVLLEDEEAVVKEYPSDVSKQEENVMYCLPLPMKQPVHRPVIAGFGPAGMFLALSLAEAGLRPIVLERGCSVEERSEKVRLFRENGVLDPESNVQFGEGGAGTFSDGKLNTGVGGSAVDYVLHRFAQFGAPRRVCYDAAPHVGTDILKNVVANIRREVIRLGGEIHFNTRLHNTGFAEKRLHWIEISQNDVIRQLPCDTLFLAIGHSARDTMEMLYYRGVPMEPKPFSMGVRIEQRQSLIDRIQYGRYAGHPALGAAPYKLSVHLPDGTGVYTFCMCPGGYVMAAASEPGGVVTNGMSYSGRAGENANSALLVSLKPRQFPTKDVLGGMYWQRTLEQAAFQYGGGGYTAPVQQVGDFLSGIASQNAGTVKPSYTPGVRFGDLRQVLPPVITDSMQKALPLLNRRLPGFADKENLMTGPETRSSSPVRMIRNDEMQSPGFAGLYPCGEGAGWAGGIVSAAVDGLRCAESYLNTLR